MKRIAVAILMFCFLGNVLAGAFGGGNARNWRLRAVSMLPSTITRGIGCIRYTYDSDGRLLKIEKGTNKMVGVMPDNPGQAIASQVEFECGEVDMRCGDVEYVDGKIERIHNEAGWTDGQGQYVAAIRDARGSLRATWTKRAAATAPGSVDVQLMHYDHLTGYYPYGLPWADRQGESRDQYEGKELERHLGVLTYDFHARRYDPQLCLFQGPDPFATDYPGLNPWLYCAANPVSLTDPTGCVIKAEDSHFLHLLTQDLIFAMNLNGDNQVLFANMLSINERDKSINPIDEEMFNNQINQMNLSEDQTFIAQYALFAINDRTNTYLVDYTGDNDFYSMKSTKIFEKHLRPQIRQYVQEHCEGYYSGSLVRALYGGAFWSHNKKYFFTSNNPDSDELTRSQNAVHELLGHTVGFALGFGDDKSDMNNENTILIENCFNRIHGLPFNNGDSHNILINDETKKPLKIW